MLAFGGFVMRQSILMACAGMSALCIAASGVQAQAFLRDRNVSVSERSNELFSPNGAVVGAFTLYPALTLGGSYDDNVRGTIDNTNSSLVGYIAPGVRLDSDWGRHSLSFDVDGTLRLVQDADDQSTTDARLRLDGTYEIGSRSALSASFGQSWESELRSAQTASFGESALEPVTYSQSQFRFGASREMNRMRLAADFAASIYDFDNATLIDADGNDIGRVAQDFRDRDENSIALTGEYAFASSSAIFAELQWDDIEYTSTEDGVQSLSGTSFTRSLGVDFDLTRATRGRAKVGYQTRQFDNPVAGIDPREDINTVSAAADIEWFVTPIITAEFGVARRIGETELATASANLATSAYARVDYELRRNLVLSASVDQSSEEFEASNREDDVFEYSVGGVYRVNRFVGVEAVYRRYERDIAATNEDLVGVSLTEGEIVNNSLAANLVLRY